LLFETHNTYNPEDRQKDRVGGVGLLNIRKRLTLSYPGSFQLETSNSENQYHVKLNLPLSPPRPTHPSHPPHSSE
jgi:two-component system, LytTR family, sensor kinase